MPAKPSRAPPDRAAPRVVVENVNVPGARRAVDKAKYDAMRKALLKVVPRKAPGATQAEMFAGVKPHLPDDLFPGGAKAEWWVKCVQLDLEAKGVLARDRSARPLRWTRAK